MRKIFKKIVESKFQELEEKISHETNEDLKLEEVKHQKQSSTLEVVKRKVAGIKKIEDKIIDICENKEQLEELVIKSADYKINAKQNIARFSDFLNNTFPPTQIKRYKVTSKNKCTCSSFKTENFEIFG